MVELANKNDIEILTELRLEYTQDDLGELNAEELKKFKQELPAYFERNLNKTIFCYLIREGEEVAACAFLLVTEKPMSPKFFTGKTGTVLNVYTKPEYRRRGYARKIMGKLLQDAAEMELSPVELKATDDGCALYKSLGFVDDVSKYHPMKWTM